MSRQWGDAVGQLDWKAQIWAATKGVYYVLCLSYDTDNGECT